MSSSAVDGSFVSVPLLRIVYITTGMRNWVVPQVTLLHPHSKITFLFTVLQFTFHNTPILRRILPHTIPKDPVIA